MSDNKKHLKELKKELDQYTDKLSAAQRSFKGKAGKEGEKIIKSLQEIVKAAGNSYNKLEAASAQEWEPLKKIANDSFDDLRNAFDDMKDSASEHVRDYANQLEEYSEETFEYTHEYIKNNPLKSILIAGGLGFIIGRVLK